jgi:hypothetical protein
MTARTRPSVGSLQANVTAVEKKGKPTFINLDSAYPDAVFTVVIWEQDRQKVGAIPRLQAHMCAKGLIAYYHGVPQIYRQDQGSDWPVVCITSAVFALALILACIVPARRAMCVDPMVTLRNN